MRLAAEVLQSVDDNPAGHGAFAEIARWFVQRNVCRYCDHDHRQGLCMHAADDERRARAWAQRELD